MRHEPTRSALPWQRAGAAPVLLGCILALLVVLALYLASPILIPITVAVVFNLLLSPAVGRLRRIGLPASLSAGLVVLALAVVLGYGIFSLSGPAGDWLERLPLSLREAELKVREMLPGLHAAQEAAERVQDMSGNAAPGVTVNEGGFLQTAALQSTRFLAQSLVTVMLLYFLLAAEDRFLRRLVRAMPGFGRKRRVLAVTRAVQRDITIYLGAIALVNIGLGTATAAAMALAGMPNPVLWGVVAGLLNFIPYVGALVTTAVLALAALLHFDSLGHALVPPGLFLLLTNLEAHLVTPTVVARRLTLDPAVVFLALVVWTWLWGVAGALLAVPLLVALKAFADHIVSLRPIAELIGGRDGSKTRTLAAR